MTFQTELRTITDTTAARLANLWALVETGQLTEDQFVAAAAALIGQANAQAWATAQTAMAVTIAATRLDRPDQAALTADYGSVDDTPIGVILAAAGLTLQATQPTHYLDTNRLTRALNTTIRGPREQTATRLDRLARAEPAEAGQRGANQALAKQPGVRGWVRSLGSKPCQLCVWWARGGQVFPPTHTMPTHKGCLCTPAPVLA